MTLNIDVISIKSNLLNIITVLANKKNCTHLSDSVISFNLTLKAMKHVKDLSIVVLGATGYAGRHCIHYLNKLLQQNGQKMAWGIAGRSEEKLKRTLRETGEKTNSDFTETPIMVCNIEDEKSLIEMTKKTKLVINCAGPFIQYGERVVDACLKAGTHYIDACGEPLFMEKMQLEKNEIAKGKGVYIVSACGFDSLPADLGLVYLSKKFDGVLNSMITYLELTFEGSEACSNDTTWTSLVQNAALLGDLRKVRKKLFQAKLPVLNPKINIENKMHKSQVVRSWVVPFLGSDKSVIRRTQRYFYESKGTRPIQIETFLVMKPLHILIYTLYSNIFFILSKYQQGRELLLKYPEVFSYGFFRKNPPEGITKNLLFKQTFYGEGWKRESQCQGPCDRIILADLKGRDPGYETTGLFLTASAITILNELNKLPGEGRGGVYTPGAMFGDTCLMRILDENQVKFNVSIKDLD